MLKHIYPLSIIPRCSKAGQGCCGCCGCCFKIGNGPWPVVFEDRRSQQFMDSVDSITSNRNVMFLCCFLKSFYVFFCIFLYMFLQGSFKSFDSSYLSMYLIYLYSCFYRVEMGILHWKGFERKRERESEQIATLSWRGQEPEGEPCLSQCR